MISKDEFFKSVSVDRNDRFGLLFFILNTLYCVKDSAYFSCYCYQEKSFWSGTCQICVIDNKFPKFEEEVEKIRYNIPELRNYFDRVQMETIRCFYDNPFLVKRFCPENMLFLAEIGARVLFGMFCCQSLSNMTIKGKIFIGLFITKTDYL